MLCMNSARSYNNIQQGWPARRYSRATKCINKYAGKAKMKKKKGRNIIIECINSY